MTKKNNKKDDIEFEIKFYEGILEKQPNFVEALGAIGDIYTTIGEYEKGLAIDKRLERLRPDDPYVLYNLACSYSLVEDIPSAFQAIKCAIEKGYDDYDYLDKDSDLSDLKKSAEFVEYFRSIQKRLKKKELNKDKIV